MEVLVKFNVEGKVVCAVTDNASNEMNAMEDAGFPHFGGFAHTLNLAVKKALSIASGVDVDNIDMEYFTEEAATGSDYEKLHKKISKLVTRLHKSSNAKREFKQCQEAVNLLKENDEDKKILALIQFIKTRWNSR